MAQFFSDRTLAYTRLSSLAGKASRARLDKVAYADVTTSLADARAAFGLAIGVDVEHIDPANGLNYSPDAYRRFLAQGDEYRADPQEWAKHVDWFTEIRAKWMQRFPHVVAQVEAELQ